MASVYVLPADRSEAARAVISNQDGRTAPPGTADRESLWRRSPPLSSWSCAPLWPTRRRLTRMTVEAGFSRQDRCRRGPLDRVLWPAAARPAERAPPADWTCPGFVDTWVKLPPLAVRAAARTPAG